MTTQQKQVIDKLEQEMRENAVGILSKYKTIKLIHKESAGRAVAGIIQYLNDPLDRQHLLDDLEENYERGLIWKDDYIKKKAALLD